MGCSANATANRSRRSSCSDTTQAIRSVTGFSRTFLGKTKLSRQTKLLVTQLVAELNGCAFCADLGKRFAQDERHNLGKISHVLEFETHPEWFTPAECAALQYALEATQVMARVTDKTFVELKYHFSECEILELTVAIASENFYNRLNAPLEIESQGFCAMPTLEART
jgi:alkylhydroperoxidase family enzyme